MAKRKSELRLSVWRQRLLRRTSLYLNFQKHQVIDSDWDV